MFRDFTQKGGRLLPAPFIVCRELPKGRLLAGHCTGSAAVNGAAQIAERGLSIAISQPLAITTTSVPSIPINALYHYTLTAAGGFPPYRWSIANGSLLSGLMLNPDTGAISGTVSVVGSTGVVIEVTDQNRESAGRQLTLVAGAIPVVTGMVPLGEVLGAPVTIHYDDSTSNVTSIWTMLGSQKGGE